jgi:hypothetical protein
MTTTSFQIGQRVTNERGAWVELHTGHGKSYSGCQATLYYATAYAPDFTDGLTETTLTPNLDRAKVERGMRQWLKGR